VHNVGKRLYEKISEIDSLHLSFQKNVSRLKKRSPGYTNLMRFSGVHNAAG
jgi:hypothetical protein